MVREKEKSGKRILGVMMIVCCFLLLVVLGLLFFRTHENKKNIFLQPEGENVPHKEVEISFQYFMEGIDSYWKTQEDDAALSYQEWKEIITSLLGKQEGASYMEVYDSMYSPEAYVVLNDYLAVYDDILRKMNWETEFVKESHIILGSSNEICFEKMDIDRTDDLYVSNEGFLTISDQSENAGHTFLFQNVIGYVYQGNMYWVIGLEPADYAFYNGFLLEPESGLFFANGLYLQYDPEYFSHMEREQVMDLFLVSGEVDRVIGKTEKISGKVLSVSFDGIELENQDKLSLDENAQIYDLRNGLSCSSMDQIAIGYDFTDFVMENGKIEAVLLARDGVMDSIRVLLRGPNLEGRFYEQLSITSDADLFLTGGITGENGLEGILSDSQLEKNEDGAYIVTSNQCLVLDWNDFREGDRIFVKASTNTQKTQVEEVLRSQGNARYRGSFEVVTCEEGFVLINELPLEEYLYAVVPSEMPSSYPMEALKAQAICARTYAYMNMKHAGYPSYGAHVDDSAGYQVYQNISENVFTTDAVKATEGELLYYEGEPAQTYYYSTSPGFGNSVEVWTGKKEADFPYMTSIHYGKEDQEDYSPASLMDNDTFDAYIKSVNDSDFEASEGWYRWTYQVDDVDSSVILERLKARYGMNSKLVLTKNEAGEFESKEVEELGELLDLQITKRLPGGNAQELVITGSKNTFLVISELYIRAVLCDGTTKVVRQSNDTVAMPSLLPSGFISLKIEKIDEIVVQYKIYGGGFGHGVGMSQNGAKAMANQGYTTDEILAFYYQGTNVMKQGE